MIVLVQALRAALLDRRVYKELSDEPESTILSALAIVMAAAIAFGLGVRSVTSPDQDIGDAPSWLAAIGAQNMAMLLAISTMLLSWGLWSAIAYYVGTKLLRGQSSYRLMLRSLGIAYGPGVALVLMGIVPQAQAGIFNLTGLWLLVSGTTAIKEAEGFNWLKAIIPALFGWFVAWPFLTFFVLSSISAPG